MSVSFEGNENLVTEIPSIIVDSDTNEVVTCTASSDSITTNYLSFTTNFPANTTNLGEITTDSPSNTTNRPTIIFTEAAQQKAGSIQKG